MSTENIELFIRTNYSDAQLAALIAHTESGKLSFASCCCLVGGATATHPLRTAGQYDDDVDSHYYTAMRLKHSLLAEREFAHLGKGDGVEDSDHLRRERLLPILYAEVERREQERDYAEIARRDFERRIYEECDKEDYAEAEEYWSDADTTREMVNSIKGR